jgi:hypothetical protein
MGQKPACHLSYHRQRNAIQWHKQIKPEITWKLKVKRQCSPFQRMKGEMKKDSKDLLCLTRSLGQQFRIIKASTQNRRFKKQSYDQHGFTCINS